MTEQIKIGDKLRPVSFGFGALRRYEELTGKSYAEITDTMSDTLAVVWSGLADGARRSGTEWSATIDDVADWLDQRPAALREIMEVYGRAMGNLGSPLTAGEQQA